MTAYLIKNAAVLAASRPTCSSRTASSPQIGDRARPPTPDVPRSSTPTGLIALPGLVDLHTHLREPGREDAETVDYRHPGGRAGRLHRGARDGQHRAGRRHRRRRRAGLAAGPRGRLLRRLPGRRRHRRARRRAARRARRDGRLRRPGPGLLRRRQVRQRRGADAPGAGVRQGVRRRRRPARPGAAAHRGRADERGRAVRPARAAGLAGRRRGGDHRPRLPARRARRLPAARLPRLHGRLGRDRPRGQGARAGTSPPRPAPTTCCSPTSWPRRTTRSTRSTRRCARAADVEALRAGLADGTIDIVATDHAPHPHEDKDCEWAAAAFGMLGLETALSIVQETHGRHRPARLGRRRGADVLRPGADRPGQPTTAGRSRSASPPTSCSTTRRYAASSRRRESASLSRNTPYAGMELPGRVVATFLRGRPPCSTASCSRGQSRRVTGSVLEERTRTPEEAAELIRPGDQVFVGSACATPRTLLGPRWRPWPTRRPASRSSTSSPTAWAGRSAAHPTSGTGSSTSGATSATCCRAGWWTTCRCRWPTCPRCSDGHLPLDVALVQVAPPDADGMCSLGVSVDVTLRRGAGGAAL